jgi:hypothetical protein
MKENEVFLVSEQYEDQISAKDFYDSFKPDLQFNVVEELEIENGLLYLIITDFSYALSRHYPVSEIYINNNCVKLKHSLNFNVKRYVKIENKKPELIIYVEQEKFWEAVNEHQY